MKQTTLHIQNLKCHGCANTIVKRLSELQAISEVIVDNENETVSLKTEDESVLPEVNELLSKLGYPVVGAKNPLHKKAKSYVSCAIGRMQS